MADIPLFSIALLAISAAVYLARATSTRLARYLPSWIITSFIIVSVGTFVITKPASWMLIVPILGFLVFIHELGHFLTAKWFGITVEEFGFGFPPRAFGVKLGPNGTIYSMNWVPLGGFVRMRGESPEPLVDKNVFTLQGIRKDTNRPNKSDKTSFNDVSVIKRSIVLCAGSFMNLVFPILLFVFIFSLPQQVLMGSVVIKGVAPGSPAELAGLTKGDTINRINDLPVYNHGELIQQILANLGSPMEFTIQEGILLSGSPLPEKTSNTLRSVSLTPRLKVPKLEVVTDITDPKTQIHITEARKYDPSLNEGDIMSQGAMGVTIETMQTSIGVRNYSVRESVPLAVNRVLDVVIISKNSILRWIYGGPDPGLAGPVGIASVTGQVAEIGTMPLLELTALISISLGLVNILPIPVLDGGRLVFVLLEGIRRGKRISTELENSIHKVGFIVLIGLVLIITYYDIIRLIASDS